MVGWALAVAMLEGTRHRDAFKTTYQSTHSGYFAGFVKELNRDFTPALLHFDCNLFNRVVTVSNAKVSNGSFT